MSDSDNKEEISKKALVLRILDVFGELVVLNVVFLIFSLPIITIGASITALYSMTFKIVEAKEAGLFHGFFIAFKKNFKQATAIWFLILFWLLVLFAQYMLIIYTPGTIGNIYIAILFITLALGALTISFVFPITARYENTVKEIVKNAFLLSISNLWTSVRIICLWFGSIAIFIIYPSIFLNAWFLWIFILFALAAFITSKMFLKVKGI